MFKNKIVKTSLISTAIIISFGVKISLGLASKMNVDMNDSRGMGNKDPIEILALKEDDTISTELVHAKQILELAAEYIGKPWLYDVKSTAYTINAKYWDKGQSHTENIEDLNYLGECKCK